MCVWTRSTAFDTCKQNNMKERKADTDKTSCQKDNNSRQDKRRIKRRTMTPVQTQSGSALDSDWDRDSECEAGGAAQWQQWDWASERVPAVSQWITTKN